MQNIRKPNENKTFFGFPFSRHNSGKKSLLSEIALLLLFWTLVILFPKTGAIARTHADTHASNFTCVIYHTWEIIVFSLCFVIILYFHFH